MNLYYTHLRGWVITEQHLRVSVLFTFFRVVGATVHLATILGRHGEVITDINAVIHQLGFEILVKQLEVNTLLEWFVRSGIEDRNHNLVQQRFLLNIAVFNDFLERARSL